MIRVDTLDNGRVTALVLNRPDRRNAMTPGDLSQLADAARYDAALETWMRNFLDRWLDGA